MWLLFVLDGFCSKSPFPVCYRTVLEKHETTRSITWCLPEVPWLLGIHWFVVLPEDGHSGSGDVGLCSVIFILKTKMCFYCTSINNTAPCSPLYLDLFIVWWKKCEWLVNITCTCFKVPSSHWLQWCRTWALKILKSLYKCNYGHTSIHYSVFHPCIHLEKLFKCCNPNHMAQSLKEGI